MCIFKRKNKTEEYKENKTQNNLKHNSENIVNRIDKLVGAIFLKGSSVWELIPSTLLSNIMGTGLSEKEMQDIAISSKRNGDYNKALDCYYKIIYSHFNSYKSKVPVVHMRGLFKVLISANEFKTAFYIASTVYADLQRFSPSNQTEFMVYKTEMINFDDYFRGLLNLIISIVDKNDFSGLIKYCSSYSGNSNYILVKNNSQIKEEMKELRVEIKNNLGM